RVTEDAARRELELIAGRAGHRAPRERRHERVRVVTLDRLVGAVDERAQPTWRGRRFRRRTARGGRDDERQREHSKEGAPHDSTYVGSASGILCPSIEGRTPGPAGAPSGATQRRARRPRGAR